MAEMPVVQRSLRVGILDDTGELVAACGYRYPLLDGHSVINFERIERGPGRLQNDQQVLEQIDNCDRIICVMNIATVENSKLPLYHHTEKRAESYDAESLLGQIKAREEDKNKTVLLFLYLGYIPSSSGEPWIRRSGDYVILKHSESVGLILNPFAMEKLAQALLEPTRYNLASPIRPIAEETAIGFKYNFLDITMSRDTFKNALRQSVLFSEKKTPIVAFFLCPRSTEIESFMNVNGLTEYKVGENVRGQVLQKKDVMIEVNINRVYTIGRMFGIDGYTFVMSCPPPISNLYQMSKRNIGLEPTALHEQPRVFLEKMEEVLVKSPEIRRKVRFMEYDDVSGGVDLVQLLREQVVAALHEQD